MKYLSILRKTCHSTSVLLHAYIATWRISIHREDYQTLNSNYVRYIRTTYAENLNIWSIDLWTFQVMLWPFQDTSTSSHPNVPTIFTVGLHCGELIQAAYAVSSSTRIFGFARGSNSGSSLAVILPALVIITMRVMPTRTAKNTRIAVLFNGMFESSFMARFCFRNLWMTNTWSKTSPGLSNLSGLKIRFYVE